MAAWSGSSATRPTQANLSARPSPEGPLLQGGLDEQGACTTSSASELSVAAENMTVTDRLSATSGQGDPAGSSFLQLPLLRA